MDKHLPLRFQALGDPTRLAVVEHLLEGSASVSELAAPHAMALPAFTKHLGVLERAGLVTSEKRGRVRTCSVDPATLETLERWFRDRRSLWEARLDRLADHLSADEETKP